VVVAGFQGILDEKTLNPVTLDRGGSDTVAVALAAKLGVKVCQIFTDVDGVYTIDPRVVPEAKRFNRIDYRKMIDLSTAGAGVLKDRSVALADVFGVEIEVLLSPSLGKTTGSTKVCSGCTLEEMENTWFQPGVAIQKGRQVKVAGVPNKPGRAHTITSAISDLNIEDVNQPPALGPTDITFVFAPEVVNTALTALNKVKDLGVVGDIEILDFGDVYRLTLIDPLMKDQIGVLNRVTGAMAEAEVSIEMLSSSGTAIMVAIKQEKEILERAARALASKFNLIS